MALYKHLSQQKSRIIISNKLWHNYLKAKEVYLNIKKVCYVNINDFYVWLQLLHKKTKNFGHKDKVIACNLAHDIFISMENNRLVPYIITFL